LGFHPPLIEFKAGLQGEVQSDGILFWRRVASKLKTIAVFLIASQLKLRIAIFPMGVPFRWKTASSAGGTVIPGTVRPCSLPCFLPSGPPPSHPAPLLCHFLASPAQHKLRNSLWRPFFIPFVRLANRVYSDTILSDTLTFGFDGVWDEHNDDFVLD